MRHDILRHLLYSTTALSYAVRGDTGDEAYIQILHAMCTRMMYFIHYGNISY